MNCTGQEPNLCEYANAMRSARAAKNLFALVIFLAVVAQLAGFVMVNFVGVMDSSKGKDPAIMVAEESGQAATRPAADDQAECEETETTCLWYTTLLWGLSGTRFVAVVSGVLLVLTILFAVQTSLLGRLGQAGSLVSAFFWSLILLALITPWQQMFNTAVAGGALYTYAELYKATVKIRQAWGCEEPGLLSLIMYYARFIAYPVVVILVWLTVLAKFARGCQPTPAVEEEPAQPQESALPRQ